MDDPAAPDSLTSPVTLEDIMLEILRMSNEIHQRFDGILARLEEMHRSKLGVDNDLHKRLLAINMLLEMPEDLDEALESELYSLRDKLQVALLER